MNESMPSSAAVSDVTFMGPPVSIIHPLVLKLSKCGECQQPQGGGKAPAPEKILIHHHPLSSGSIYISET